MTHPFKYQCIECGCAVESLYRDYKAGIIKISHCNSCKAVADKYIEYDPVIIFLDALLLQPQAYRHLLINTQFDSHWRLALLLWICDAFTKLVLQRSDQLTSEPSLEPINYSYLGLELYLNYIIAATELFSLLIAVLIIYGLKSLYKHRDLKSLNAHLITKAIIVASVGRILAIPALLWGQSHSYIYLWLCQGFVCLSSLQALRVVSHEGHKSLWAILAVSVGFTAQVITSSFMHSWFEQDFV